MAFNDPNKKPDTAYEAGASVRRFIAAPTAYDSMGRGYMAQSQATSQATSPARSFARGLVGAAPETSAPPAATRPNLSNVQSSAATRQGIGAATAPSQSMTYGQANTAEVNARSATQPSTSRPGVGAPVPAGGAAPSQNGSYFVGSNGVRRTINADGGIAGATPSAGSVNRQVFGGTSSLTRRPQVASTFGMSVNDPRANDQVAPVARPSGILRGPDAMAEQYASREDREARQKLASDLDSQRFRLEMIAGNPGRRGRAALDALGQNSQQQAALAAGAERLSADAVQGRANRANVLANTGLEQAGADNRAQLADATAREGQQLSYRADMARTGADIVRPQLLQDAEGNYISVAGGRGEAVTRADGSPVRGLVSTTRNFQQEADDKLLSDLIANQVDAAGAPLPNAVELARQQFAAIRKPAQAAKPTWEQFKAANPGGDEAKLRAYYTQNYGN